MQLRNFLIFLCNVISAFIYSKNVLIKNERYLKKPNNNVQRKTKMSEPTEPIIAEDIEGVFEDRINDLVLRLEENARVSKTIAGDLKVLKKEHIKIVKKMAGTRRKKVPKDPNAPPRAPSGFAKPTKISAELATFLGVSEGEMIARPDVTKGITKYVKEHNLQKEDNKRVIDLSKPGGEALVELLNIPSGEELTFFNLQRYLKIHFPVSEKEPKVPKPRKEKAEKTEKPVKASKKETKEVADESVETKKRGSKKAEATEATEEAPKKKASKKVASQEETPKPKVNKVKAKTSDEEVPVEEAPVEESKPRRRRRAEE